MHRKPTDIRSFSLKIYFISYKWQHPEYGKTLERRFPTNRIKRSLLAVFIPVIIEPGIVIQRPGIVAAVGIVQAKRPFLVAPPFGLSAESSAEVELVKDNFLLGRNNVTTYCNICIIRHKIN